MYKPRPRPKVEPDIDDIKSQIRVLTSEIKSLDLNDCTVQDEIRFDEAIKFLEGENSSLKDFVQFEKSKNQKLEEEDGRLSKQLEEEMDTIHCLEELLKAGRFPEVVVIDDTKDTCLKLELLHVKICTLIKKFAHDHLDNDPSDEIGGACAAPQKSLVDFLKLLLPELDSEHGDEVNFNRVISIDDTIDEKHVEFLIAANIIERCVDDPHCVKLLY